MKNPLSSVSPASSEWNSFKRVYWTVAAVLAFLLLMSWIAGFGPGGRACKIPGMAGSSTPPAARAAAAPVPKPSAAAEAPKAAAPAVVAAPSAAVATAVAPAPAAPPPAAKLYFALDKTALPQNTVAALLPAAEPALTTPKVVVIVFAGVNAFWAVLWCVRPWPTRRR